MLIALLVNNSWLALVAWIALYVGDYALTIWGARLYESRGRSFVGFEGAYELTPYYQKDISALRIISPRFLVMLAATCAIVALIWYLSMLARVPALCEFMLGMLLLLELAVHFRHWRNIISFRFLYDPHLVQGRVQYARKFLYRQSAFELMEFSILYLVIFLLTGFLFFLGGTATCFSTAFRHWHYSNRTKSV